jgi:hypothetical protein
MSIKKSQSGSLVDQSERGEVPPPKPPEADDGDITTPKSGTPTDDHQPLE